MAKLTITPEIHDVLSDIQQVLVEISDADLQRLNAIINELNGLLVEIPDPTGGLLPVIDDMGIPKVVDTSGFITITSKPESPVVCGNEAQMEALLTEAHLILSKYL